LSAVNSSHRGGLSVKLDRDEVAWGLPVEPRSAARDQRVLPQAHAQVARLVGDD
jgi:hypothetical protein